jgi:hypothetical protein
LYSIWRRSSPRAGTGEAPGEAPVFQHPGDVEIFEHNGAVLADDPGGQVVQAVAAGVRDSGVEFRDSSLGCAPPPRGQHLSGAFVRAVSTRGLAL